MFHETQPPVANVPHYTPGRKNELPLRGRTPERSIDNVERVVCAGARYMRGTVGVPRGENLNVPQIR